MPTVLKKPSIWIACVFMCVGFFYLRSYAAQNATHKVLLCKLSQLETEKTAALEEHGDLLLQVNSQNDPAWIEMVLMKELGLVPEGHVKVYFEREK